MNYSKVIAIDGPSGSGKSTIAQIVARKIGHTYIDTGAMFRAIGLHLDNKGIKESDIDSIQSELNSFNFNYGLSESELVVIDEVNLTQDIRQHFVSDLASRYSKISTIRDYLREFQRSLASSRSCVMEGRDIGTVIFPNAYLKVFLTATDEVRAVRRQKQLELKGETVDLEKLIQDIKDRDDRDSKREIAPLIKASDAHEILTDDLEIDEVVSKIIELEKEHHLKIIN